MEASEEFKQRIMEHDAQMRSEAPPLFGSQRSLDIFSHSPKGRAKPSQVPGLLRNSPDGTPLQLRRAMFLKNMKNKGKISSLDIPDPDSVPLLNRITNGANGMIT